MEETLFNKSVKDFPFEGEVYEVLTTQTVNSAFKTLGEKGYLSAPIWDAVEKKYVGMFDVNHALSMIYTIDLLAGILPSDWVDTNKAISLVASPAKDEIIVGDLLSHSQSSADEVFAIPNDFYFVYEDASMQEVLKLLAEHHKRVPVLSKTTKRVVKIITASKITKLLDDTLKSLEQKYGQDYLSKLPKFYSLAPKDIERLDQFKGMGIKKKDIISVKATDLVRDAFMKILENKVSAVAVLDEDGMLLSSISNSDIRMFHSLEEIVSQRVLSDHSESDEENDEDNEMQKNLKEKSRETQSLMDFTCEDFVKLIREECESKKTTKVPYVSVSEDFTFRRIISKLAFSKKHRVWITDAEKKVVNVVSVSDIAQIILSTIH